MSQTVTLAHEYTAPPQEVWRVATDWVCLKKAVAGIVEYDRLPDEPLHAGQVIKTNVSLFGKLPSFPYTMEVIRFDPDRHVVESHEHGGAVKSWDHTLTVSVTPEGARLTDRIVIDAGWLTPLYALWARFMYARRHKPRLEMLGLT